MEKLVLPAQHAMTLIKVFILNLGGVKTTAKCETCHPNKTIVGHEASKTMAECTDCHMPLQQETVIN